MKYLGFKNRTSFHTLCSLAGNVQRESQGSFSMIQLLHTYANTFLISSSVLAINSKQYAWIRGLISTGTWLFLFLARKPFAEI